MKRSVDEGGPQVDERIARQYASEKSIPNALFYGRNVLPGDATAGDLVDELKPLAGPGRLEIDDRVAVLALAPPTA